MERIKRQEKITNRYGARFVRAIQCVLALSVIFVQGALPIAPVFASDEVVVEETSIEIEVETISEAETEVIDDEAQNEESEVIAPESDDIEGEQVDVEVTNSVSAQSVEEVPMDGDEGIVASETVTTEIVADATVIIPADSEEPISETDVRVSDTVATSSSEARSSDGASTTDTTKPVSEEDVSASTTEAIVDTSSPNAASSTALSTTTTEEEPSVDVLPVLVESEPEITEPIDVSPVEEDDVSPTNETAPTTSLSHIEVVDNSHFSFSEQECARVGDGTFYCTTEKVTPTETGINRVFAGPDADGDSEIFIESEGTITQISFNQLDDSAPYYDERSDSLVWHRLINGRYQIVAYDFETGEEKVLTADRYNNMQPSRYGDVTVWQGWVGDDWEIMLDYEGELSMLTDNVTHDVGPQVNGDYIIWQSFESGVWKAKIYNIQTEEIETIADTEGSSVENPRFVLVYDSKSENGDVETRGYDLLSGTNVPLSSQPAPVPTHIPDPDQTGEDRALIVATTQLKTKSEDDSDTNLSTGEPPETDTEDDLLESDLVIPEFPLEAVEDIEEEAVSTTTPETITDIVIPQIEILPPLPDLIIPPYENVVDEPILPQSGVATSS